VTDLSVLALLIPCAYCGAAPDEPCVRRHSVLRRLPRARALAYQPSGRASYTHTARSRPIWTAYWAGLEDARADRG
jgi:hypothetical protein